MLLSADLTSLDSPRTAAAEPDAPRVGRDSSGARVFLSTQPAGPGERKLAFGFIALSVVAFAALAPFAKTQLAPLPAFIPLYQSALIVSDLLTAVLLFSQYRILRRQGLLVLAAAYLFTGFMAVAHTLSFPGLFAPGGLLGAGPQTTAWLYMFWHSGFPVLVVAYAVLRERKVADPAPGRTVMLVIAAVALAAAGFTLLATAGHDVLPAVMSGNGYTPALIFVTSSVWACSLVALFVLWRRKPHSVLDLWLMVVMCAWLFDIALAAVLNHGRFDLGFYAGRIYGFVAATLVLIVLLLENGELYARLAVAHASAERALARHAERLRILHEIDQAMVAEKPTEAIAAAVIQPLRELLGVARAIVNRFDLAAGEVEWIAAAGRRRTHVGPGVRYSMRMMGDVAALRRGETQIVDTRTLPQGRDTEALLASGVNIYMVVPMISGGELLGALSFGSESDAFPPEQVSIAREVATQLAIAMTQARLLERVRRQGEERFRLLVEGVRDYGIFMLDPDGNIASWNAGAEHIKGYREAEVLGKHFSCFYTDEDRARNWPAQELAAATVQGAVQEVGWRVRKDGSRFWASVVITALRDERGTLRGFSKITRDLSAQKQAEDDINLLSERLQARASELEAVNKELSGFSYSVSHDLRAPLRAVDGYARMLEEDYAARLDDEGRRLLGVIRDSAARMGQLIDDLLNFSRLGRQPLMQQPVDVAALVREVVSEVRGGYAATPEVGELPPARGDRALLKQVWLNLIGNAFKYSAKRSAPRIEIGGQVDGEENIYWVRDNGAGFDMRYAAKLFGVFQRLHSQEEFAGTGVGLAIVQRVVARHDGRVWAEGKPDAGACFYIALRRNHGAA